MTPLVSPGTGALAGVTPRTASVLPGAVRLPSLTSLRWFAASMVFLIHAAPLMAPTAFGTEFSKLAYAGASGVCFFFILSGFVLTWTHRAEDRLTAFYRRRVARIAPAYWAACVVGLTVAMAVDGMTSPAQVAEGILPATFLQSWVPDSHVYFGGIWIGWSLSTEVFFYACFPLLIGPILGLASRHRAALLGAALAAAILVPVVLAPAHDDIAYWLTYICPVTRLLEFVVGICLCAYVREGLPVRIPTLPAAALVLACFLLAYRIPVYLTWVALMVIPFSLVIVACAQSDLAGRTTWWQKPTLIRLGQWSYCFYLLHYSVLRIALGSVGDDGSVAGRGALVLACYLTAIAAAFLLFRLVELPLERRIRHGGSATPASEVEHPHGGGVLAFDPVGEHRA
jgi:peptidoglycan/LPS O-acetylase OafA/YrhL